MIGWELEMIKNEAAKNITINPQTLSDHAAHYGHEFRCNNCGERNNIYIKRGVPIADVEHAFKCKRCECFQKRR